MALLCIITPASMREVDLIFLSFVFRFYSLCQSDVDSYCLLLTPHQAQTGEGSCSTCKLNPHPFFIVLFFCFFFSLFAGIRVSDAPSLSIATSGLREQLSQEEGKVNWLIPACCTIMLLLWYDQKFGRELINLSI